MVVQFESQEPVETPMDQDTPFDHTYCREFVLCRGGAFPDYDCSRDQGVL
jgi:hypothetical protein